MNTGTFSVEQMKCAKAIVQLYETGKVVGDYGLLVVLNDGAGITYGKTQTTENSGGLWTLIFEDYNRLGGSTDFSAYRDILYDGKDDVRKGNVTGDEDFKALLKEASLEDEMRKAQDQYFHRKYFRPALELASAFAITKPLILTALYDLCIHSGPQGALSFVEKYDAGVENSEELAWGRGLIEARLTWLRNFTSTNKAKQAEVRKTAYRAESLFDLVEQEQWDLTLPLKVKLLAKVHTLTADIVALVN